MKYNNNRLITIGKITLWICAVSLSFQHTANGQEPVGPTKPVVVVNTPDQPVPVTGTVTGVVTLGNTPNVNVLNTPTVRIDPSSNTVVVAPSMTQLVLNTGVYDVSQGSYPATAPLNVASFSKIRVMAINRSDSDGPYSLFVTVRLPGPLVIYLDDATLQPGQTFNRTYDVPGQVVQILVGGNGPNRNGAIAVFGH